MRIAAVSTALFVAAGISFAGEELSLQLNGFADTYHAIQLDYPHDWMSSRTRLRLEMRADYGAASLFTSLNLAYNGIIDDQTGAFLREAYFDYVGEYLEIKAGRQIVTWGVADGIRITDLISPMDYTEFMANDYDDIRVPVNAIDLKYPGENFAAEFLFVPVPEYFVMPTGSDNPWSTKLPARTRIDLDNTPEKRIKNSEFGTRLRFFLEAFDFSLVALRTYNKAPVSVTSYDMATDSILISGVYKPMSVYGADMSLPVGEFVLRLEFAEYFGEVLATKSGFDYSRKNTFNALGGIDWYAGDNWTFMVQYMHKYIADHRDFLKQDKNVSMVTARISKEILNNTLKFVLYGMLDVNDLGFYARGSVDYQLNDQITLSLGTDVFGGDGGTFAAYDENTQIWAKGKYFF